MAGIQAESLVFGLSDDARPVTFPIFQGVRITSDPRYMFIPQTK
jgi:hypothetical protein